MNVFCLYCGDETATVTVSLDADHEFGCVVCEATWTAEDVRQRLDSWSKVLTWVEASPFRCAKPADVERLAAG